MSLFRGTIRPPAILSDDAVERYLAAIREELAPDPLFRRRLRGEVMNRFVATREGLATAVPQRRSMGKLGRAVLYASFTLALSATSVLAVSQTALPGDALYPLKRHVEELRMQVLPEHFHHDLAAYELAERIDELARLTERGDEARATALAAVVAADFEKFIAEADAAGVVADDRYVTVLTALLDRLPEPAQDAVQAVLDRAASHGGGQSGSGTNNGNGPGQNSGVGVPGVPGVPGQPGNGNDNANQNGTGNDKEPTEAAPEPTPRPTKSPKPDPTPRESASPKPTSSPDSATNQPSSDSGDDGGDENQDDQ